MTIDLLVPALGESVVEATVAKWMKSSGDNIKVDEPIIELETEKVTLEVPSPVSGVLSEIIANEGDTVEVGALLGKLTEGENIEDSSNAPKMETSSKTEKDKSEVSSDKKINDHLSPAVQRLVTENHIDVSKVKPSGKDGRITKGDVLEAIKTGSVSKDLKQESKSDQKLSSNQDEFLEERVPMSRLRKVIAKRLKDAQNTAAMLTTFNEVDM